MLSFELPALHKHKSCVNQSGNTLICINLQVIFFLICVLYNVELILYFEAFVVMLSKHVKQLFVVIFKSSRMLFPSQKSNPTIWEIM